MTVAERACEQCGEAFTAKRSDARFCSAACRSRHRREVEAFNAGQPLPGRATTSRQHADDRHDMPPLPDPGSWEQVSPFALLDALTAELAAAGVLHTVEGLSAIALARRLVDPTAPAAKPVWEAMQAAREKALGTHRGARETDREDEVAKAREARERKAREAAARA